MIDPLSATDVTVCHYLGWLAESGTVSLDTNVYTSAINTVYRDLMLKPPADSPLVTAVRTSLARLQTDENPSPREMPLPAKVVTLLLAKAGRLRDELVENSDLPVTAQVARLYTLRAILFVVLAFCTISRPVSIVCLPVNNCRADPDANDKVLVVNRIYTKTVQTMNTEVEGRLTLSFPPTDFHRDLADSLAYFDAIRKRLLPRARWFFQLPLDSFVATPERNNALASAWFATALATVPHRPPTGTVWVPRSCRSGGASSTEAANVHRSKTEFLGGWVPGSTALAKHYIDPATQPDAHCVAIFGFLAPRGR